MTSDIDLQRAIFASFQQQIISTHRSMQSHIHSQIASHYSRELRNVDRYRPNEQYQSRRRAYSPHISSHSPRQATHHQRTTNHVRRSNGRVSTLAKEGIAAIPTSGALRHSSDYWAPKNSRVVKQKPGALGRNQWDLELEEAKRKKPELGSGSTRDAVNRDYTFEDVDDDDDSITEDASTQSTPKRASPSRAPKASEERRRSLKKKKSAASLNGGGASSTTRVIHADSTWLDPWMEKVGRGTIQRHHDKGVFVLESSSSQKPFVVCYQEDALESLLASANYNIECRFKMLKSSDQQTCAFIVNYKSISKSKCSYVAFVYSAISRLWKVEKHIGERRDILAQASAEDYHKQGQWNQVSIEVRGNTCTLFHNDHALFENVPTTDDKNDGKIGFSAHMTKVALKNWQIKEEGKVSKDDEVVHRSLPVGIDRALADQIRQDIILKDLNVAWEDIAELGETKRLLQEAVVLPMIIPECFNGLRKPWAGILMYGPPGTGKTMLAKAVSSQARSTFFNVSASTVVSKYHGESEKMIRTLFEMARHYAPSVIFFDEIDSIISKRGSSTEHEASRRLKSELLSQMDGISSDQEKQVLVLATTNRPWDLDSAIIRRLEKRIYVPLPNREARKSCFEIFLKDLDANKELDYDALAKRSKGFSGADIKLLCRDASMVPMRRALEGKGVEEIIKMKQEGELTFIMSQRDFEEPFKKVKPSVGQDDHTRYEDWTKEFGSF